jgi:Rod binding domain-containing protein
MDISEISLSQNMMKPVNSGINFEDERNKEIAKEFEGIFVRQLLEKMQQTIPNDEEEDSSTKQVKSMFWSFLGDSIAENGGLGLWENVYESMPKSGRVAGSADQKLNERA